MKLDNTCHYTSTGRYSQGPHTLIHTPIQASGLPQSAGAQGQSHCQPCPPEQTAAGVERYTEAARRARKCLCAAQDVLVVAKVPQAVHACARTGRWRCKDTVQSRGSQSHERLASLVDAHALINQCEALSPCAPGCASGTPHD